MSSCGRRRQALPEWSFCTSAKRNIETVNSCMTLWGRGEGGHYIHARFHGLAEVESSWNIWMRWFKIYGKWSVQTSVDRQIYTHTHAQCSHASVGLAQARPNNNTKLIMLACTVSDRAEVKAKVVIVLAAILQLADALTEPDCPVLQGATL